MSRRLISSTLLFIIFLSLFSTDVGSYEYTSLDKARIDSSDTGYDISCIEIEDVIYEYGFGIAFNHNNVNIQLSNEIALPDCDVPSIQKDGSWLHILQANTEQITLEEILNLFSVDFQSSVFFGQEIDAWSYGDCPFSTHDNETNSATRCEFASVSIGEQTYDLWQAVELGVKINHGDWVNFGIESDTRYPEWGPLTPIDGIDSCTGSSEKFLPTYSYSMKNVLIQCDNESRKSVVYDFHNLTKGHSNNYQIQEEFDEDVHVINPGTQDEFLWVEISSSVENPSKCSVKFLMNGYNSVPEISHELTFDSSQVNYGSCADFSFHSISPDERYSVILADQLGVLMIDMDTMLYETIISTSPNELIGAWMGQSNQFVFMDNQNEQISKFDPHTSVASEIMQKSELEQEVDGDWYDTTIESAPYLSNETLMLFTKSLHNSVDVWGAKRIDFENNFQEFEVIGGSFDAQPWEKRPSPPGCESNHPAFLFRTGVATYFYEDETQSLDLHFGQFAGCHRSIIIGDKITDSQIRETITFDQEINLWSEISKFLRSCPYVEDFDNDGIKDSCDFDVDGDGVMNWDDDCEYTEDTMEPDLLGNGCFLLQPVDLDMDGILNSFDNCEDGFRNWSSYQKEGWGNYDNDLDGCHDKIEDNDDDNDGYLDSDDDCPYKNNGHVDLDGDGLCAADDLDDDGDGFSDLDEEVCGSNSSNPTSLPLDTDSDMICNDVDPDIDGDNYSNDLDAFPLDRTEWNDLDQDGIGNNSDDCVGTYGTSTVDRLGCLDQDGDGVSDLNDLDPYDAEIGLDEYDGPRLDIDEENETNLSTDQTDMASESDGGVVLFSLVGVFIVAGIIIFVRSRRSSVDEEEEEYGEADESYKNVTTTPVTSSDEPSSKNIPDFSLSGSQHESGYEVLEYPEGSEQWWWKDTENQCWVIWE